VPTGDYADALKSSPVELISGAAMVVIGVILQVNGASADKPNPTLTVTGGILTAFGGVLLSWMASRALAAKQAKESAKAASEDTASAMQTAQGEVDEKLNNLSRVLGQAAGQISQAVEKVESGLVSEVTGFELISQANRMIYGQVNEIAVIRNSKFDPAFLLETVTAIQEVTRDLSSSDGHRDNGSENTVIASALEKLERLREGLSQGAKEGARSTSEVLTTCPYCEFETRVILGTTPGDTATNTCSNCGQSFNAHRNSAGAPFTRRRGPKSIAPPVLASRWMFRCPNCDGILGSPKNGKGERLLVCPKCFSALKVDAGLEIVASQGIMKQVMATECYRSGSRPKTECPECGIRINMPLRYSDGYFGYCADDRLVLTLSDEAWEALIDGGASPSSDKPAPAGEVSSPS
jgi:hypothetical protein